MHPLDPPSLLLISVLNYSLILLSNGHAKWHVVLSRVNRLMSWSLNTCTTVYSADKQTERVTCTDLTSLYVTLRYCQRYKRTIRRHGRPIKLAAFNLANRWTRLPWRFNTGNLVMDCIERSSRWSFVLLVHVHTVDVTRWSVDGLPATFTSRNDGRQIDRPLVIGTICCRPVLGPYTENSRPCLTGVRISVLVPWWVWSRRTLFFSNFS